MPNDMGSGLSIDAESLRELGYASADINAPAQSAEPGSRVFQSRESTPIPRRGMLPIAAWGPGGDAIFDRMAAEMPNGGLIKDGSPELQADFQTLAALSFPIGDVPCGQHRVASADGQNAAQLLIELLRPLAEGRPVDPDLCDSMESISRAAFGIATHRAWILAFLPALRQAALQRLNWDRRLLKLDEERRAGFPEPPALLEHAARVLEQTRRATSSWRSPRDVPDWLDINLTASLIPRCGFEGGGGGTSRVISEKSMRHLLNTPGAMIKDLEKSPDGSARWKKTIEKLRLELARSARGSRAQA